MHSEDNRRSAEQFEESVDPENVASRAGGRPPEERSSEIPDAQARAILEESEERIAERVRSSDPLD